MKGKVLTMEFVTENLEMHYAKTLRKFVSDCRQITHGMFQHQSFTYMTEFEDALKKNARFNKLVEEELVWTLNDWAIEEDEVFAKTVLRCVDRYYADEISSSELLSTVSKLAELMELRAEAMGKK